MSSSASRASHHPHPHSHPHPCRRSQRRLSQWCRQRPRESKCLPCKWIPCSPCDPNSMDPLWFFSQAHGWAASHGQLHTVMVLAKNGADIEKVNGAGFNARSDAAREGHQHVVRWVDEWRAAGSPRGSACCAPAPSRPAARAGAGVVTSHDMQGCWLLCGLPLFWEIAYKGPLNNDANRYTENGIAFLLGVLPCPVNETWTRNGNTSSFRKDSNGGDVVDFQSGGYGNEKGWICKCKMCPL
mmetsp:Transcript_18881/g.34165  ORF Transcript_18881/g.34165 Transcript_18881/m.34165 type:complete len:241 (-) Transcript_18881:222-944(-)